MENLNEENIPPMDFKNDRNQKTILNNKTKIFAVIVVIAVLGIVFYTTKLGEKQKTEKQVQEEMAEIVKNKNFEDCAKIKDNIYKTACVNNIALNLAKETKDISYCQKIDDKLIPKADCERQVVFVKSLEKENVAVCKETVDQELQKQCEDSFYSQLALKKDDVKICDQSLEKDKANYCYNNFLISKNFSQNPEGFNCSSIRGIDAQKDCEASKNNTQGDALCTNLKTSLFLPYCFTKNYAK